VDLVSEQCTSAAKRAADELQCELRTVCADLWCHSHQTSHETNILYYTAKILAGVDRQAAERHRCPFG